MKGHKHIDEWNNRQTKETKWSARAGAQEIYRVVAAERKIFFSQIH